MIEAYQDAANTILTVNDTGVGIPEEAKRKFSPTLHNQS
jgi:signal transduction histidine kinase